MRYLTRVIAATPSKVGSHPSSLVAFPQEAPVHLYMCWNTRKQKEIQHLVAMAGSFQLLHSRALGRQFRRGPIVEAVRLCLHSLGDLAAHGARDFLDGRPPLLAPRLQT